MAYGFLLVSFPEKRQVFVNGEENGPTNNPNATPVGTKKTVTLAGDDYDPPSALVDISINQTTTIIFSKRAGVVQPAGPPADADT
jgi:hypothetical protein